MRYLRDPRYQLGIGVFLLILGWVLPVLMVMQFLPSTYFLNFLAYIASFIGLMFGIIGIAGWVGRNRRR